VGPQNERQYGIGDFSKIIFHKSFSVRDGFTDKNEMIIENMPQTDWDIEFAKSDDGTKVTVTLLGPGTQLERLVELGFEEGFRMALGNLDEELATHAARR